jgi:hypothetical protein
MKVKCRILPPAGILGMTSKTLWAAEIKLECEFPDVYLDFIRQYGMLSVFQQKMLNQKLFYASKKCVQIYHLW